MGAEWHPVMNWCIIFQYNEAPHHGSAMLCWSIWS